jgi:hypothetical protein
MSLIHRSIIPALLIGAVACLLLFLRFGNRGEGGEVGTSTPDSPATNGVATRPEAEGRRSSTSSKVSGIPDSTRFVSERLNRFDKLDCRRAYDSGVKELAPELATLSWMLKTYHLDESNHYLAVMRLYELVHRHSTEKAGKKEELERTVQSWSRDGAPGSDPDKVPPNDTRDRLETLREIAVRWDQRMAETRSEAGADLQELVGVVDGDWLQAVFGISPQTLPTVFEYVPKGTPAPVRSDPDE